MAQVTVSSVVELRAALADSTIDIINVLPGDYTVSDGVYLGGENGFNITRNVTIRAAGGTSGRANFHAATDFSKGLFFVAEGASVTFDRIGFFDTRSDPSGAGSSNEAGIRFEGNGLTITNSYFGNNKNAILGTSQNSSAFLVVRNTSFIDNGTASGQEHAIYFAGESVDIEGSEFVGFGDGHAIKTIAHLTRVVDNIINDAGYGFSNHPVNLEGGGSLIATGNTITKSSNSSNTYAGNPYIFFTSAARSNDDDAESILIENNIIDSGYLGGGGNPGTVLLGNFSGASATMTNNTLTGSFDPILGVIGMASFAGNTLDGAALPTTYDWAGSAISLTAGGDDVTLDSNSPYYSGGIFASFAGLAGNDTITSASSGYFIKVVDGGAGDDHIEGGAGNDYLFGGIGADVLLSGAAGGNRMQYLDGGEGDDYLLVQGANSFADILVGGAGADVLDARMATGADMGGGTGNDILIGSNQTDAFSGGGGDDIVYGNGGREQYLFGGEGVDTFVYQGNFGSNSDLDVEWLYGTNLYVVGVSSAGQTETGGDEQLHEFEYIQFGNGVYDIANRSFSSGDVRVALASILALDPSNYIGGNTGGGSGGSTGSGNIPYPVTTNVVAFNNSQMDGTGANDMMELPSGQGDGTWVRGFDGDDHIIVGNWNSGIAGGSGSDVIEVRQYAKVSGDDEIDRYGGLISTNASRSADYFVFDVAAFEGASWEMSPSEEWARIADFDLNLDKIALLNAGTGADEFSDLSIVQNGTDTEISSTDTATIVLQNFSASSLTAADFIFTDASQSSALSLPINVSRTSGTANNQTSYDTLQWQEPTWQSRSAGLFSYESHQDGDSSYRFDDALTDYIPLKSLSASRQHREGALGHLEPARFAAMSLDDVYSVIGAVPNVGVSKSLLSNERQVLREAGSSNVAGMNYDPWIEARLAHLRQDVAAFGGDAGALGQTWDRSNPVSQATDFFA